FLVTAVALLALLGAAQARTSVLVHQFDSQDVLLGAALAAEVADALEDATVVIGPEVASAAVPPIVVEGGFVNAARVIEPGVMFRPAGAALLREATGVDVVITGYLEERDDRVSLFVTLSHAGGIRTAELTADPADPQRLVFQAAALVADARAVALAGAGMLAEARTSLEGAVGGPGVPDRAAEVLADIVAVVEGDDGPAPTATAAARRALLAVQDVSADVSRTRAAFQA